MSQMTVERIVDVIQNLSEEDRSLFDKRLAEIDEAKWEQEAALAREIAEKSGIDEAEIDRQIAKLRYG